MIPYLEESAKKGRYGSVPLSQSVLLSHTTNDTFRYSEDYSNYKPTPSQSIPILKVRENQNVSANLHGLLVPHNV